MKRILNSVCSGLALASLVSQAIAATPATGDNPYQVVVERNVFDLKPLIPPPKVDEPPPTPPAKITLQGITDILGKKQVLLKILELPKPGELKPGEQPKERALIMDEGERRGTVTVMEINPKARTVKFDNAGREETLELTNAPTKFAGPIAGVPPGAIPTPVMTQPGASLASPPAASFPGFAAGRTTPNIPARSVPARPMRTVSVSAPPVAAPNPPRLTAEEQTILMEVERERTKEAVARGDLPPLPPTEITPPGSAGLPPPPPVPGK